MKILLGILLFFSFCTICIELNSFKYYKLIKVQYNIDNYFRQDRMYYISDFPAGSDDSCSSCHYYFKGFLKTNNDTVSVLGKFNDLNNLLKNDEKNSNKLFFNVWYSEYIDYVRIIKNNNLDKFKPKIFDLVFLRAWLAYFLMLSFFPLLIFLIKKSNES